MNRILLLLKGVGQQTVNKLLPVLKGQNNLDIKLLPAKCSSEVGTLLNTIFQLRAEKLTPAQLVEKLIKYYRPILQDKYDDFTKREKDLEHFEYLAHQYTSLENFLSDLALEPPDKSVSDVDEGSQKDEYLTISTIHSAKGLEWNSVFIIGAVDGRFPSVFSFNSDEEMDEELRLMYVASTRAKTDLYITYPIDMFDHSTGMVLSKPSRFIEDIDETLLEKWIIEKE